MYSHKHLIRFLSAVLAAVFVWHDPSILHIATAQAQDLTGSIITTGSMIVGMIITGLNFLMWVLFWLLTIVTNPDIIFQQGMVELLHEVWAIFRNIVNVAFALVLVIGAIMTIVTASTERVKAALPKFVMAVILVNFSWFIPRVIYDVSSILTHTIYQLPSLIGQEADCFVVVGPDAEGGELPEKCKAVNDIVFFEETDKKTHKVENWDCTLKPLVCVQLVDYDDPQFIARHRHEGSVFNGLIVNYARLRSLASVIDAGRVAGGNPTELKALLVWFVKVIVVLVIHIALFFPILALVAAFFIRIPILWLTMAFMPFVALGFVVDQLNWVIEKVGKQFIKAAFLPAMVGVPFALGFIMINTAAGVADPELFGNVKIPLIAGVNNFGQIFWLVLSLGVLWASVFAALKEGGEYVDHFTDTIKSVGESAGRTALKAPLSVPILPSPVPGQGYVSTMGGLKALDPHAIEASMDQRNASFWDNMKSYADAARGAKLNQAAVNSFKVNSIVTNILNGNAPPPDGAKQLSDALKELRDKSPDLGPGVSEEETLRALMEREKWTPLQRQNAEKYRKHTPPAAPATPPAGGTPPKTTP